MQLPQLLQAYRPLQQNTFSRLPVTLVTSIHQGSEYQLHSLEATLSTLLE